MAKQFKYDEAAFKPKQREVALALVEREFADKKDRKSKEAIAEEHGTTKMTIWRWENNDPNFIAYKNHLASEFMDSRLAFVYGKMIEGIGGGNAKLIELFLKRIGDLDTKSDINITRKNDEESQDERLAKLQERLQAADDEEDEDDA